MRLGWALSLVLCLADQLSAQAALQLERQAYRRLELLRADILRACLEGDMEQRNQVARILAEDRAGSDYLATLRALAFVSGQEADQEFVNRAGIIPLVLPHVVDPEVDTKIYCTMYAPRRLTGLGKVVFDISLEDASGKEIGRQLVTESTSLEELLRFRPSTEFPLAEEEPGRFRIQVRTLLDERPPGSDDLVMSEDFDVLPGFASRVKRIQERVASLELESFDLLTRAIITGAYWQTLYILQGDPAVPADDPIGDLERLEAILNNVQSDMPALFGLAGRMTLGLPAVAATEGRIRSQDLAQVSVDLPRGESRDVEKPLLLFVAGRPAWGFQYRPQTPKTRRPEWLLNQLRIAGFDAEDRYHVAVMESAGRYEHASRAVARVLESLHEILPVKNGKVILIGEREGAWAVGRAVTRDQASCAGLVLVTAAAIAKPDLESLAGLHILGVTGRGHPGNAGLLNLSRISKDSEVLGSLRVLSEADRPWPIALAISAAEIEAFAAEVFAR
ncbi:MAG: hypothetical protein ACYTG5_01665 [Planctomycetota bacterium]|jgi:pimeloyl-ACP methyl ester carboxylesterase